MLPQQEVPWQSPSWLASRNVLHANVQYNKITGPHKQFQTDLTLGCFYFILLHKYGPALSVHYALQLQTSVRNFHLHTRQKNPFINFILEITKKKKFKMDGVLGM